MAAVTCPGKVSGHTSGSRSAAARRSAASRTRSAPSGSSARQRRCSASDEVAVQVTWENARSTRSVARYVNGQARSKKNCACTGSRLRVLRCAASRRSARSMTCPMERSNETTAENWRKKIVYDDAPGTGMLGIDRSTPNLERTIPAAPPPKRHPYDQWSPDARALDLVGDKWTLLIIRDLAAGPRRFVELQRVLPGISTEQLRSRLNRMVADGLLTRQRYREVPPRVDYELT